MRAVVGAYLSTGEPVASRTLAQQRSDGLSPATIRNILAALEDQGLLHQPHTSAGRVPTLLALRMYAQALSVQPRHLSAEDAERLHRALDGVNEGPDLLARACQFLSDVTQQMGLVLVAPWTDAGLKHLRFIRLTGRRVLAVLIAGDGQVRERVARLPEDYSQDELDAAARYFNAAFPGWTLQRIRRELIRRIDEDRAAYDELLKRVLVLYHCGVLEMQDRGEVYLEGTSHLLSVLRDHERMAGILSALTTREKLLGLLSGILEANQRDSSAVRIEVGLEQQNLPEFALIAAPYIASDLRGGTIAILGATRMEYERAVSAVCSVRDVFQRVLSQELD